MSDYHNPTMTYEQARTAVESLLFSTWQDPPAHAKVSIYTWDQEGALARPLAGFRVAEVSFSAHDPETGRGGGGSYMQVDTPHGIAACALVERLVIAMVEGWDEEEIEGERWRLLTFYKQDAA